jgi:glycosyltransferase involved in cell wall biosynthesis
MFLSVVIPTYNRLPILRKCLQALEAQRLAAPVERYEVVLVDDGSTDDTVHWLDAHATAFPHVRLIRQDHGGPAEGRNRGVEHAHGDVIVFIDSDLVVTPTFLASHARALESQWQRSGDRLCFTYGAVINTADFDDPTSEPHKPTDHSWAYFATGNVAIDRHLLVRAGLFDTGFRLYGWEDLELGERLRRMGVRLVRCPEAVGYHWHPPLSLEQIPDLVRVERERAKMGLVFYRKHPTRRVRFIIQFTWLHRLLWEALTLGGLLNERSLRPVLAWLIRSGRPGMAMELLRLPLNRLGVRALHAEARSSGLA